MTRETSAILLVDHDDFIDVDDDEALFGGFEFLEELVDLSIVPVEDFVAGLFENVFGVKGGEFRVFEEGVDNDEFNLWIIVGFGDSIIRLDDGFWFVVLSEFVNTKKRKILPLDVDEGGAAFGKVSEGVRFP